MFDEVRRVDLFILPENKEKKIQQKTVLSLHRKLLSGSPKWEEKPDKSVGKVLWLKRDLSLKKNEIIRISTKNIPNTLLVIEFDDHEEELGGVDGHAGHFPPSICC